MENLIHREILEENARVPSLAGKLDFYNYYGEWISDKTGNTCELTLLIEDSRLTDIRFCGQGSALSQACGSIMCKEVKKMDVSNIIMLSHSIIEFIEQGTECKLPGDLVVYETISRFVERHDCSLLCWRALSKALQ